MPPLIIVALISAGAGLVGAGVDAAVQSPTECGKICRAKCKNETGWLFSGRKDCKNRCKEDCVKSLSPQEKERERKEDEAERKKKNTYYIIIGVVFAVALGLALYLLLRKK